jgi:hypothetical protein
VLDDSANRQGSQAGTPQTANPAPPGDGKEMGGYQVQQNVEFGYRFTDVNGSQAMYGTLINQNQGPRLLEQTLSMRSPLHDGLLFDDLSISSFGWGGDPENVAQARMSKFHYYDSTFLFRRDQNYFDYDLLANPLNPPTSNPSLPVGSSPHSTYNTRRMYDFDLTILPRSKLSFRVGMTHNRSNGPSFASLHVGTDALLNQDWSVTDNLYRFGFDVKALSRTTISYDQFLEYGKNDTGYSLSSFSTFLLPNGVPVDFGLPINTSASQPCSTPIVNGAANPSCNGFFAYHANQRLRTTTPTEQLRLVSNYWHRVSLTGQGAYSHTDMSVPYQDFFDGLSSRSGQRQATTNGTATARRVNASADLGVTVEVTRSIRISDTFRYDNWHLPGNLSFVSTSTVGVPIGNPPTVTLLSPLGATTTSNTAAATFLGMRTFHNLLQVEYNPDRFVGVHVGYKIRHRRVFHAEPESAEEEAGLEPFEGDTIHVNEQGPLFGVWLRPTDKLRVNVEAEAMTTIGCQATCPTANEIFISRISPRQRQNYRGRVSYKPSHRAELSGSVNWWEARNGEIDIQLNQHYRNAGFVLSLFPSEKVSLDLSYNYTDALQDAYICYNGSYAAPGTTVNGCPTYDPANTSANNNPNWIYSNYSNVTHYFNGLVVLHPVKKLTANIGYGLTHTEGSATILNTLQPLGPLQYSYHQPLASLGYEVVKDWSLQAYWNYDQYGEGSFVGPTLPRYFHDNRAVVSVRYAF